MYKTTINRNRKGSEAPVIDPRLRRAIMKHAGIDALRAFDLGVASRVREEGSKYWGIDLSSCFVWKFNDPGYMFWSDLHYKLHKLEGFPL